MMRIIVDGNSLFIQRSGVGQYAKRLIEAFIKKYPETEIIIVGFVFLSKGKIQYPIKPTKKLKYRLIRWLPARVYNQLYKVGLAPPYDLLFRIRSSDTVLLPNFVRYPMLYNRHSLLTVHDLSFVHSSQFTQAKDLPYKRKFVPISINRSEHILTISKNSKNEIMRYYKVPDKKISIAHPGVDTAFFYKRSVKEINKVRRVYNLPDRYILFTGTLEPRKNIDGILSAYEKISPDLRNNFGLVLAGGKGWKDDKILKKIEELKARGLNILLLGYIPDADLPAIFSGASVFVFPSFYEGFGIPTLEAMACGTPVVSANNSSLPEVIGDAGILVNANSSSEIAQAIDKLISNKELRENYITKGYKQVQLFNWENSADQLMSAVKKLNKF